MNRLGFTMIELLVALVLTGVGIVATLATSAVVVREADEGRTGSIAVSTAANRLEWLRSHACIAENGRAAGPHGLTEAWSATLQPGSLRELEDSTTFMIAGSDRTLVLRSRTPC
jgi:prepilin-type N-terminal cleavage/methylation domain-containing protein